jgi:hypothetical protein
LHDIIILMMSFPADKIQRKIISMKRRCRCIVPDYHLYSRIVLLAIKNKILGKYCSCYIKNKNRYFHITVIQCRAALFIKTKVFKFFPRGQTEKASPNTIGLREYLIHIFDKCKSQCGKRIEPVSRITMLL